MHHDVTDNGTIGHNLLRQPAESLGFSSNFRLGIWTPKPTLAKIGFALRGQRTALQITVR